MPYGLFKSLSWEILHKKKRRAKNLKKSKRRGSVTVRLMRMSMRVLIECVGSAGTIK
jgi:hypothetical protein